MRHAEKSLLVIGGSGFFGKSVLDAFRRGLLAPWGIGRIIVVARQASRMRAWHPLLVAQGVELIDLDIGTASALPHADYVLHAASSSDARNYAANPLAERANILAAIENYCRIAARDHQGSRIVYASSGAVYGQQPADVAQLREDFTPGDAAGLVAYKRDYAEAKRLSEDALARLGARGLAVSVARCFAFAGAYLPRDQHFAIGNFIADGLAGRPVRVLATRPVVRSYMHADDLVRWLMTIAHDGDATCPTYNVGSDEAVTMHQLAAAVAARFGVGIDAAEITDDTPDLYVPSIAKARDALGLTLDYDLTRAIDAVAARLRTAEAA
ncbi:NAD-dependent epimerase/dehydratase family protein [Sphingomonas immobilis]|uniref:NAD(P)-dependent oxidoreductase n=1 Tax=Sphingomonas immobilis TaxID=3063997 RepID=A0ABT9A2D6_9SPHN|nr:NAD(P)-dependent oxidoreductase [Sphingomonas sp. CA1-15]MDO7843998.1 NAD(P)-dependent oxidoreductase [Sphingomonas sp. CA1-15]